MSDKGIKIEDGLRWFTNLVGELREKDMLHLLDDMASVEYLETEAKNFIARGVDYEEIVSIETTA